jgi:hypothetical protein
MADFDYGTPSDPFEPEPKKQEPFSFDLGAAPAEIPEIPFTEAAHAQVVRPLTPRRMGDVLEKKMLPAIEGEQKRAEDDRLSKLAGAKMELGNMEPWMQKALAASGSAADAMTAGVFPYIPAALAKGAGKFGVPGYERYADMPLVEAKKEAERKVGAASTIEPGYAAAGTTGGILLGAKTLPAVAPARGPAISGGLTGGVYGGISGGAAEGDIGDAVKGAIVGTLGGAVAAPILERVTSGLTRMFFGGKPVVDRSGALTEEAMAAARAAGLTDQEIATLAPQLRQAFERRGVTPAAAAEAPFGEFNITPKRGMVTGDAAQLEREARYGNYAPQAQQAAQAAQEVAGGSVAAGAQPSVRDAVADAVAAGNREAAALQSAYQRGYAIAENTPGEFTRESISNLGDKIMRSLGSDPKNLTIVGNDAAIKAAQKLDSIVGAKTPVTPTPIPGSNANVTFVVHRTFQTVEQGRKALNQALRAATDAGDRRAIRRLIDEYDRRIEQNINNGAFSGNPNVIYDWLAARRLYSEYQGRFGIRKSGEDAGQLMRNVLDGTKSADDVGNAMFNFATSGDADLKRQAVKTMLQLRRALGPNSPELDTIKRSYMQQVMTPRIPSRAAGATNEAATGPADFARVATNIDAMLTGKGSEFSRRFLNPAERGAMARYADVMRRAGQVAPEETASRLRMWGNVALATAPAVVGTAITHLAEVDPKLAAVLSAAGSVPGAVRLVKGTAPVQTYLANRPPANVGRPYRYPAGRTALPLAATAEPGLEENVKDADIQLREYADKLRGRQGRASGGAVNLMALSKAAKKQVTQSTEALLNESDDTVARALEVANKHI